MRLHSSIAMKPLAAALAVAVGAAGTCAHASDPPNAKFQAQLQAYKNVVARMRQNYAQHPEQYKFFQSAPSHAVHFPKHRGQRPAATAATIAVTSCVDNGGSATTAGTLRYAVLNAANGDVIDLSACNASTITLTQGALPVSIDDLTITAGPGNHVTIDGNGADRVIFGTGTGAGTNNVLALEYLTIRNGKSPVAPIGTSTYAVAVGGCIFSQYDGVALYNSTVTGCQAVNPSGVAEGGGIAATGLYMLYSTVSNNQIVGGNSGGGTSKYGGVGGGAVSFGPTYVYQSHVDGNSVTVSNGGNIAAAGGLLALSPTIEYSTISNNSISLSAGSSTTSKYLALAGGLWSLGGGSLYASTVSGNSATYSTTSTTTSNTFCLGGGVFGTLGPSSGSGALQVAYSTISGNHADFIGGGISAKYNIELAQSTISGNSASAGAGLALSAFKYGGSAPAQTAVIDNSTIAANTATYTAAGIFELPYTPSSGPATAIPITLTSSIVARNNGGGSPSDIYVPSSAPLTITGSNNLVMSVSSGVTLPAGTLSADPLLAPLANNGGPTRTMGLLAGSPALDAGSNPDGFTNDQRGPGFPRVVGVAPDIGAFEGTVILAPSEPTVPAPALSAWAMALLVGLLGLIGWRRRAAG